MINSKATKYSDDFISFINVYNLNHVGKLKDCIKEIIPIPVLCKYRSLFKEFRLFILFISFLPSFECTMFKPNYAWLSIKNSNPNY